MPPYSISRSIEESRTLQGGGGKRMVRQPRRQQQQREKNELPAARSLRCVCCSALPGCGPLKRSQRWSPKQWRTLLKVREVKQAKGGQLACFHEVRYLHQINLVHFDRLFCVRKPWNVMEKEKWLLVFEIDLHSYVAIRGRPILLCSSNPPSSNMKNNNLPQFLRISLASTQMESAHPSSIHVLTNVANI